MDTLTIISSIFFGLTLIGALYGFFFVIFKRKGGMILDNSKYWYYMIISFVLTMIFSILSATL